ncbi:MAG: cobalt ECF transporter T component CbiQ [Anaerolineales bacterium]|nr:cobalt ECF transporter T component CbiQ [Anaerolineales bacterium]
MHVNLFDRYQETQSFLHRLDPRVKVLATIFYVVSNALLPDGAWFAFFAAWIFLLACNALSKLGWNYTLKRSLIALPFALIAITVLFTTKGTPLFSFELFSVHWALSLAGITRFAAILIRSWLSVQMALLLVAATTFPDLIHALEHLRIPKVLTAIIAFLYRYLFVLTDESFRLLRAREARSVAAEGMKRGGSLLWRAKNAGNMVGQLFLRSYERSDRIYQAMTARGYSGRLYTLNPHEMKSADYFAAALTLTFLSFIQILGRI